MDFPGVVFRHVGRSLLGGCALWLCFTLAAAPLWAKSGELRLMLRNDAGTPIFTAPVREGDIFAITYTHSVAQTPVTDYFFIKDKAIWLEGSVYHDFGAGLPHNPEHGQKLRQEHGRLIMSGYAKCLGSFDLRVGRVAGHELILFSGKNKNLAVDKVVPLSSLVPGGGTITFSIEGAP